MKRYKMGECERTLELLSEIIKVIESINEELRRLQED